MKSVIYSVLLCIVSLVLATGCQRQSVPAPPEIHYGVAACADCKMIISDPHCAAALAWRDPSDGTIQTASFDDIGCLLAWRRHHTGAQIAAVWVKNIHTAAWLDATSAFYLEAPGLQTPMGSGVVAGGTINDFAELPVKQPLLDWTDLLNTHGDKAASAPPASLTKK